MQPIKISLLALFSSYVAAQDIDDNDVPSQCRSLCASVVTLTQTCDRQNDNDDRGYINCVCSGTNAASEIPACEACIANFDRNDGHDNDVNDLVRSCFFTQVSFTSSTGSATAAGTATAAGGSSQITLTGTQTTQTTPIITGAASSATSSLSSILSSTPATASDQIASLSSQLASLTSAAASPTDTGNAASANGVNAVGVVCALFLGMLGLA